MTFALSFQVKSEKLIMTRFLTVLLIIALGTILWLGVRVADYHAAIEAGVVEEAYLRHQCDFLVKLPKMIKSASDVKSLEKILRQNYPETLVEVKGDDICFGFFRLKFINGLELVDIIKGCK